MSASELEGLLEKAGFAVNQVYGGYEEENFSANSPRLIFVAIRKMNFWLCRSKDGCFVLAHKSYKRP